MLLKYRLLLQSSELSLILPKKPYGLNVALKRKEKSHKALRQGGKQSSRRTCSPRRLGGLQ